LREVARIGTGGALTAADIAFRLAPRLNAAGRLGDPTLSLSLLRAKSLEQARVLAGRLEQENERRRRIEAEVTSGAFAQVEAIYGPEPRAGIVAAAEGWHKGVVGISAARLVDRYGVPAIVIALEDGVGHGSCRAPSGFDGFAAVSACGEHLVRFGGHAAASGLSVRAERVDALRAAFSDATAADASGVRAGGLPAHAVDIVIGESGYGLPTVRELSLLEPMGEANAEPLFLLPCVSVEQASVVGRGHLKLMLRAGKHTLSAFGLDLSERLPVRGARLDVVGALRPDAYRGADKLELRIVDFAPNAAVS
jgi:single-stranded-DNA-specific exonuclease